MMSEMPDGDGRTSVLTGGRFSGMTGFTMVALGQFLSLLGTSMTGIAITIWAWQVTGTATALALLGFFVFIPKLLFGPLAGALVDRWNRKLLMILVDLAAGVMTVIMLGLYLAGNLAIWHLFVLGFIGAAFGALHFPAYSASVTLMVPKEQYGRASAMIGLAQSIAQVLAPVAAGALIGFIGLGGILTIDLITMSLAVGTLLLVRVPQPKVSTEGAASRGSLLQESLYGFRYILRHRSLLLLQSLFAVGNFISSLAFTLTAPLILARTANNALVLGSVQSVGMVGGIVGGLLITAWGGPERKINGVLLGWAGSFLMGSLVMGLGRSPVVWAVGMFLTTVWVSLINSSNQAIWQRKVQPDVQGRVFAARSLIAQIVAPVGQLLAGPLADRVFEPAMQPGGALAETFGGLVGTGIGTGMSLMFVIVGLLGGVIVLGACFIKPLREAETLVPDYDEVEESPAAPAAVNTTPTAEPADSVPD